MDLGVSSRTDSDPKTLGGKPISVMAISEDRRAGDRIGTKHDPDIDPDYRWNSCVPHLLAVTMRAVIRTIYTQQRSTEPGNRRKTAPHSSELWHYTT